MALFAPGTCRHCGCHADRRHAIDGDECAWTDGTRTVCTAPGCIQAEQARLRAAKDAARAARPKSVFHELIRKGYGIGAARIEERKQRERERRRKKRVA